MARAAEIYPARTAVVHGTVRRSYAETYDRCRRLAGALADRGVGLGDTVSILAPNVPAMLEAHFGVPMAGAVLNALNIRLDAASIALMLNHARSRVLIADAGFANVVEEALAQLDRRPHVVVIDDPAEPDGEGRDFGDESYEALLAAGAPDFAWPWPEDEWQAVSLNYTSGTTGRPKGVVYHHRGAYLNALSNVLMNGFNRESVYLWTLPMFHCNGWTHTWAVTAAAGTHVCLRRLEPAEVFRLIVEERVTHMAGAPVVLGMLINAPESDKRRFDHTVEVTVGGSGAACASDCRHGGHGLQRHPFVRSDRGLWSRTCGGASRGVERASARRARCADRAPGRAPSCDPGRDGGETRRRLRRSRPTAQRWARSCCAETR